jgi:hypothetical protein
MLPGPAEDHLARPRLHLNVLPAPNPVPDSFFCSSQNATTSVYDYRVVCCLGAFAMWEVFMAGRPDVRMEQIRFCSTDCLKVLWCVPLVKYVEKRKAIG